MNICMVMNRPFPANRGTPIRTLEMCKQLSKKGHIVHLVTYHLKEYDIKMEGLFIHRIHNISYDKISPGVTYKKLYPDFLMIFKIAEVLRKEKIDVIHSHLHDGFFLTLLAQKLVNKKYPILFDHAGSFTGELQAYGYLKNKFTYFCGKKLEDYLDGKAEYIIIQSRVAEENILGRRGTSKNLYFVPCGVDIEFFYKEKDALNVKNQYGLQNNIVIGYTGNLAPYQGVDDLIKSIPFIIQKHPEVRLLIVGGIKERIDIMKRLISEMRMEKYVIFAGRQKRKYIPAFINESDILVSPRKDLVSSATQFPTKLSEYMSLGKPVVATSVGVQKQIIEDGVNGLLAEGGNPESIAEKISAVLDGAALRTKIGNNAKEYVNKNLTWDFLSNKLIAIYEEMQKVNRVTQKS